MARRDKRGYEWKSAYREKEALMRERGYPEVRIKQADRL